jgi:hypothetical protein
MKVSYSKQQGCSYSRLPQNFDNEKDKIFMTFPKGKIFKLKKMSTEINLGWIADSGFKLRLFVIGRYL